MRGSSYIITLCFLSKFFFSGTSVVGSSITVENLLNTQEPLRMDDLDNSEFLITPASEIPLPLIFPAEISFYKMLDLASRHFQSLDTLGKLPVINKFDQVQNSRMNDVGKSPLTNRSSLINPQEKNDTVAKFINSTPSHFLPTDDELESFFRNGLEKDKNTSNSTQLKTLNSASNKTFAEFRNEAESSLISQILNRSSSRKKMQEKDLDIVQRTPSYPKTNTLPFPQADNSKELFPVLSSTLKLKARKPNFEGKLEPAQASEFYLTTKNLNDLLQDIDAGPAVAGEITSVAELWAKAEKNAYQSPEVALGIKSILLQAKVSKARTDPYGEAALRGVQPDEKYYLIGIDKDVLSNVVTIWSKEVEVQAGENVVELSSNDVIYQN